MEFERMEREIGQMAEAIRNLERIAVERHVEVLARLGEMARQNETRFNRLNGRQEASERWQQWVTGVLATIGVAWSVLATVGYHREVAHSAAVAMSASGDVMLTGLTWLAGALAWLALGELAMVLGGPGWLTGAPWRPLGFRVALVVGLWWMLARGWWRRPPRRDDEVP